MDHALSRSLEGLLKHPVQTLGNLQVKPCNLCISLPQVPQQRENIGAEIPWQVTVVTARECFYVVIGLFYTSTLNVSVEGGDQTTGRQGQLASKFRSQLAAKLAASLYYVLFYYIDIVDISHCRKTK